MGSVWHHTSSGSTLSSVIRLVMLLIISDGLHLTSEGYRVVFESLKALILTTWPELAPETMVMPTPQSVLVLGSMSLLSVLMM